MRKNKFLIFSVLVFGMLNSCGSTNIEAEEPGNPPTPTQPSQPSTGDEPNTENGFVRIKGGTFTMGSPTDERWREKDEIQHSVTLNDFFLTQAEVSQKDYHAIMGNNPSYFKGDDRPVEMVSWYDAVNYCNALSEHEGLTPAYRINGTEVEWNREANGFRLPTEAEWEYACRAGTTSPFNTGRNITVEQANWYSSYPYIEGEGGGAYRRQTVSVNEFDANAWGLYNMHGNVSEWCWDRYGAYSQESQSNPTGPQVGINRVARGGGWYDYAKHVRSAYRSVAPPDYRDYKRGFRIARNATR